MRKFLTTLFLLIPLMGGTGNKVDMVEIPTESNLSSWDELQLAIAITESRMNPKAEGKTQDIGIYQITPIYAKEASRISKKGYSPSDAYSIEKSIEMFNIVQGRHNPSKDIRKAIKLHNPGASEAYYNKVMANLEMVKRYESIRKELINYGLQEKVH